MEILLWGKIVMSPKYQFIHAIRQLLDSIGSPLGAPFSLWVMGVGSVVLFLWVFKGKKMLAR
jgi:hypothetical protein